MNSTRAIAKLLSLQTNPTKVTMTITVGDDKSKVTGWAVELIDLAGSCGTDAKFTITK